MIPVESSPKKTRPSGANARATGKLSPEMYVSRTGAARLGGDWGPRIAPRDRIATITAIAIVLLTEPREVARVKKACRELLHRAETLKWQQSLWPRNASA